MESAASEIRNTESTQPGDARVDPRAPRFGQALTALGLGAGIVFQAPEFVYAIAIVLNAAVLSGWRVDLYGALWRAVGLRIVGPPLEREPAAPHRFAKVMGAGFTAIASLLLLAVMMGSAGRTVALAGYAVAGVVALLAGVAAAFDICVGCRMYRQISFFRDLGVV